MQYALFTQTCLQDRVFRVWHRSAPPLLKHGHIA